MALALGKPCNCGATVHDGTTTCDNCKRAKWRTDGAARRERNTPMDQIYRDKRWNTKLRMRILKRDRFHCYYGDQRGFPGCEGPGYAKQVAHIEYPDGPDDPRAFGEWNLTAACATCNRREETLRRGDRHRVDL